MATKSYSTQQAGAPITGATMLLLGVAAQLHNGPVKVLHIEGNVNSTTGSPYYIQLLGLPNGVGATSGTTIPLWSRLCVLASAPSQVNGFAFDYDEIGIDTARMNYPEAATLGGDNTLNVWVAISSTDNVWTSVVANTEVTVDVEQTFVDPSNETIAGDQATGVDALAVFTDPHPAYRLTKFAAQNVNLGATGYIMLFAYAAPADGSKPIAQWAVGASNTIIESFGVGLQPIQGDASYVPHYGCYLYGSSTAGTLTKTVGTNWYIQAWYQKAQQ